LVAKRQLLLKQLLASFKRLRVAMDETKESIGEGLLPIVEDALAIAPKVC
jgi:hypothetical protein